MNFNFQRFLRVLKQFEGLKTEAYLCTAKKWTIGVGTIKYPDGTPVKKGDKCTIAQAMQWAEADARQRLPELMKAIKVPLEEHQIIVLLSLAYNVGTHAVTGSKTMKLINANADLKLIEFEFKDFNQSNGKVDKGLVNRRNIEWNIYTGKIPLE